MSCTRIWLIKEASVAQTIADACIDDYSAISPQAGDLAEILDLEALGVGIRVSDFIKNFKADNHNCKCMSAGDNDEDCHNRDIRIKQLEARV